MESANTFGQPVGASLGQWAPPQFPHSELRGPRVTLASLDTETHAADLFEAFKPAPDSLWTYMWDGPFETLAMFTDYLGGLVGDDLRQPYAVVVEGRAVGFLTFMRIDQPHGVLEIGTVGFSPLLQRTTAATEALYLMLSHAFELGYRRCEWKCDQLNQPSRDAALRLGFTFEGTFRKATHYKGRNRDTDWFAIVDDDWPELGGALERWLEPENFDETGMQRRSLAELRAPVTRVQ